MNRLRPLLIGSLVAGILLLMWVLHVSVWQLRDTVFDVLFISLAFSLGSLLGIWVALGGQASAWRFLAVIVAGAGCVWLAEVFFSHFGQESTCILLAQSVLTGLLFWVLRFVGVGLVKVSADGDARDPAVGGGRFQFSLRSLLEWTTALAVLLGLLHYLPDFFPFDFVQFEIWFFSIPGSLVAMAAFWATLGTRWAALRFATLGLVVAVFAVFRWGFFFWEGFWGACAVLGFLGLQALWEIEVLRLFRSAGYRISVRWKRARNREEES